MNFEFLISKAVFKGFLKGQRKYNILSCTHVFLLNSKYEAQPLVVIEALYFKCFIVLSELEMLKEFGKFRSVKFFSDPNLDEKAIIANINDFDVYDKISKFSRKLFDINRFEKKIHLVFN